MTFTPLRATPGGGPGTRVTVARTPAEVESLRPLWETLDVPDVDADLDYFLTVVDVDPDCIAPHVLLLERDESTPLLVVARLARQRFPLRLGYLRLFDLRATALVASFEGILGARSPEDLAEALAALNTELAEGVADLVLLQKVPVLSPLSTVVQRDVPPGARSLGMEVVRHALELPGSFEELLGRHSTRSRSRIRRELRQFRSTFGDRARLVRRDSPDERERMHADIDAVARTSYQEHLHVGSVGTALRRRLMDEAIDRGRLRSWILYLDGSPVAFWTGIAHQGTYFSLTTAYDPRHAEARVGYISMLDMFAACCADPAIDRVDFGPGDAEYKRRFASVSTTCHDVRIFSPRLRSRVLKRSLDTLGLLTDRLAPRLARSGPAQALKRAVRRRGVER